MNLGQSSALLAACVSLAVTIAVLLRDARKPVYVRFSLFAFNLFVWHLSSFLSLALSMPMAAQLQLAAGVLLPASSVSLFSMLAWVRSRAMKPLKRVVLVLSVGFSTLAFTPILTASWARAVVAIYVLVSLFLTFQIVWQKSQHMMQKSDRLRLRSLALSGVLIVFIAMLGLLGVYDGFFVLSHVSVALYVYFLYQSIITYRFIDITEIIAKASVLAALTLVLVLLSQILVSFVGTGFGPSLFNTFVLSFVILILYDQLRSWIEQKTVRLIFRERFELHQKVQTIVPELRHILDVKKLIEHALNGLFDAAQLMHLSVYLMRQNELSFALVSYRGQKPDVFVDVESHGALLSELSRQKTPLLKEQFERRLQPDPETKKMLTDADKVRIEHILASFLALHSSLILPLLSMNQDLIGFFCLSDVRFSSGFSAHEIALFYQVANQMAISVENSEQFERIKERDRLAVLGEMSAGLAHEIRNPLGAIKGAAQMLEPKDLTEETQDLLNVITEEVDSLNRVVSQFLEYARPIKPSLQISWVNEVIQKVVVLFQEGHKPMGASIDLELQAHLPAVKIDPDQLKQVLFNLLLNARDACESKSATIVITTKRAYIPMRYKNEWIEIAVKDNGCGIDTEQQKRIFLPFFTTKPHGTGLGLAISQRLITSHGGRIDLESKLGEGTVFTIRLPVYEAPEGAV